MNTDAPRTRHQGSWDHTKEHQDGDDQEVHVGHAPKLLQKPFRDEIIPSILCREHTVVVIILSTSQSIHGSNAEYEIELEVG